MTPEEVAARAAALALKPKTVTADAGSVTQIDADELKKFGAIAATPTGTNPQGGRISGWRQAPLGRSIPPGTV